MEGFYSEWEERVKERRVGGRGEEGKGRERAGDALSRCPDTRRLS